MFKKTAGIVLFAAMAVMFFASCANGDESSENNEDHYGYYVSELDGYVTDSDPCLLNENDKSLYFSYNIEETILPFNIYTMEIRKDSKSGEVLKTVKFLGKDIEGSDKKLLSYHGLFTGKIKDATKSDIPNYGKNNLYYVLTKAEKPVIKFTVEDSVKALIPEGYEAVIQVIDFNLCEIRGDGEEHVLSVNYPEESDLSNAGIMLEIIKKGVVQDHQIPIEVLLGDDNLSIYDWTASLSINKMTKQTTGDKDVLGIISFQEFLTKENLGEDNTINVTLSSFNKTTE